MEEVLERDEQDIDLEGMFEVLEEEFDTEDEVVKKKYEKHLRRTYPAILEGMAENLIEYNGKTGYRKNAVTANNMTTFLYGREGEGPIGNRRMSWGLKALYALSEAEDLGIVQLSRFGQALKFDFTDTDLEELKELGERMSFLSDKDTEQKVVEYIVAFHNREGEGIEKNELLNEFEERMGYGISRTYLDNLIEDMEMIDSYEEFNNRF